MDISLLSKYHAELNKYSHGNNNVQDDSDTCGESLKSETADVSCGSTNDASSTMDDFIVTDDDYDYYDNDDESEYIQSPDLYDSLEEYENEIYPRLIPDLIMASANNVCIKKYYILDYEYIAYLKTHCTRLDYLNILNIINITMCNCNLYNITAPKIIMNEISKHLNKINLFGIMKEKYPLLMQHLEQEIKDMVLSFISEKLSC